MVLDTSAIVGILREEPEYKLLSQAIASDRVCLVSAVTVVEATLVLEAGRATHSEPTLDAFLTYVAAEIVPFDGLHAELARGAFRQFGKGRHRAALNLLDCCVYALAKERGEPIPCRGNDFAQTDIPLVAIAG